MRIYLDNCCYNRPYDDQSQLRIYLESQAKMAVQTKIRQGEIELVTSYMNFYESSANPYEMRRVNIQRFLQDYATVHVSEQMDDCVLEKVTAIENTGIKHKDACHVACAVLADCDFFLTTDDRLLKYKSDEIELLNPVTFINLLEG
ncbi:MAG: hypothetical protein K5696_12595 [Lachnospiraceae bacterium]|nr:hypothetical protein [Lachnospiraceae bacterium]